MDLDVSRAEGAMSSLVEEEAAHLVVEETINVVKDHDYTYNKVGDSKLGKKIHDSWGKESEVPLEPNLFIDAAKNS